MLTRFTPHCTVSCQQWRHGNPGSWQTCTCSSTIDASHRNANLLSPCTVAPHSIQIAGLLIFLLFVGDHIPTDMTERLGSAVSKYQLCQAGGLRSDPVIMFACGSWIHGVLAEVRAYTPMEGVVNRLQFTISTPLFYIFLVRIKSSFLSTACNYHLLR
jgi:hypothetical protein